MQRIGILGGTFDPVHIGHLIIAESVLEELKLDKVIFIPNGKPPHKNEVTTGEFHRLNMLLAATEDNLFFEVSDIELYKNVPSYTVDTIKNLYIMYPDSELFFIMGADCIINIRSWHNYSELLKICKFAIVPRVITENRDVELFQKAEITAWIKNNLSVPVSRFIFVHSPVIPVSSTFIRNKILENKSVKYLLPPKVSEYINKEGLYKIN